MGKPLDGITKSRIIGQLNKMHATVAHDIIDVLNAAQNRDEELELQG